MPAYELFDGENQAQRGLDNIQDLASDAESRVIGEDYKAQVEKFTRKVIEIIDEFPSLQHSPIVADGPTVLVPKFDVNNDSGTSLTFAIDPSEPYVIGTGFEPIRGEFHTTLVGCNPDELDGYSIKMILRRSTMAREMPLNGRPFAEFSWVDFVNVPLGDSSGNSVEIDGVRKRRVYKESIDELAKLGLRKSRYEKSLRSLQAVIATEDQTFKKLDKINLLRRIGSEGKTHIEQLGVEHQDPILDSAMRTIGSGRHVTIASAEIIVWDSQAQLQKTEGVISGNVLDVCSSIDGYEGDSLMLIIQDTNNRSEASPYRYVPINAIDEFHF